MEDENGQIQPTHSISAGLDYPGVGPEHAWLKDSGRVEYVAVNDAEAVAAFHDLTRTEGIMPALESSHALAHVKKIAGQMDSEETIIINLSRPGRQGHRNHRGHGRDHALAGHESAVPFTRIVVVYSVCILQVPVSR